MSGSRRDRVESGHCRQAVGTQRSYLHSSELEATKGVGSREKPESRRRRTMTSSRRGLSRNRRIRNSVEEEEEGKRVEENMKEEVEVCESRNEERELY